MNWLALLLTGVVAFALSGPIGMLGPRHRDWPQWVSAGVAAVGATLALVAAFAVLLVGPAETVTFPGPAPTMTVNLRLGPLSAFFLVPIFFIGAMSSIYGLGYWRQSHHPRTGRKLRLWYGILIAAMAMLTLCENSICFLICWEIMALSAFFLIATEDQKPAACQAAWVYLVATHVGTLTLFALFALLRVITGSFLLRPILPGQVGLAMQSTLFVLALVGFGIKAGIMPLHFWLPEAHANAPSHVSATLSGVMIKMGIFGLLRVLPLLPDRPLGWGILVLMLGAASALLGVLWAMGQHDLKRLLAYHSVENIGIILLGLGMALLGQAQHQPIWIVLGMAGCLLHVWNHGLFKSLLFLSAGSVVHATGTRDIDRLGGLAKSMKITAPLFLLGAIAICGLPPLNGFISELFIYLGLLRTMDVLPILSLAAAGLALVGALAMACFTKAFGAVFLGTARTALRQVHESGLTMWLPMVILAAVCVLIGVAPELIVAPLTRTTAAWTGRHLPSLGGLFPAHILTAMGVILIGAIMVGLIFQRWVLHRARTGSTWACGYSVPSSRMQYTASSLAQMLLTALRPLLRWRGQQPRILGVFAEPTYLHTDVDDPVLKDALEPLWLRLRRILAGGRVFQQGSIQNYLLYMLLMLVLLLLFTVPLGSLWTALF